MYDGFRLARLLLDHYGTSAVDLACDRLCEASAAGDMRGCAIWAAVLAAINRLRSDEPHSGEAVN